MSATETLLLVGAVVVGLLVLFYSVMVFMAPITIWGMDKDLAEIREALDRIESRLPE